MALIKEVVVDRIEIVGEYKQVQVRTATVIKEDGKEISRSFHRHVISPNSDISKESAEIKDISNLVHTPAVKTAWADKVEADKAKQ